MGTCEPIDTFLTYQGCVTNINLDVFHASVAIHLVRPTSLDSELVSNQWLNPLKTKATMHGVAVQ